ncbi:ABC transporter permease [Haloarchaeobius iranensis]|uniref:Nucleoside ABC transporter membrane protein n=1 Tax=Haloarchaeobius iranensis TaxID=996166 RepID=A0A1G9W4K3_9EURY|nr:ABC transporter permease [Haloarchaeobius iranensis]SDM79464.1 nucleoside ABC transporter membrane protein [Haloarchaeobius iranensis]
MSRARDVLERLVGASGAERAVISVAALALSIVVGGLIVFVSGLGAACEAGANYHIAIPLPGSFEILLFDGRLSMFGFQSCYDPINVYEKLFIGAIGGLPWESGWQPTNFSMEVFLQRATLLLFTGLSVAVAFRAGLFNIGTQGQMVWGALTSAVAVLFVADFVPAGVAGTVILLPLALFAGAVAGGIWGAIPGALKAYADANEVITTIMLNFVAYYATTLLVREFFQDPQSTGGTQTRMVPVNSLLPSIPLGFQESRFSILALVLALVLAAVVYYVLWGTSFGFDVRTSGLQPEAATYAGVDAERTIVRSMTISGALGGIAGALWVLLANGRFLTGQEVPSLGFDGITVSVLAGNNPIGVVFGSVLFGVLKSGGNTLNFQTDVPPELVNVLSGLIILFVAMPEFFRLIGKYLGVGDEPAPAAATTDGGEEDG